MVHIIHIACKHNLKFCNGLLCILLLVINNMDKMFCSKTGHISAVISILLNNYSEAAKYDISLNTHTLLYIIYAYYC